MNKFKSLFLGLLYICFILIQQNSFSLTLIDNTESCCETNDDTDCNNNNDSNCNCNFTSNYNYIIYTNNNLYKNKKQVIKKHTNKCFFNINKYIYNKCNYKVNTIYLLTYKPPPPKQYILYCNFRI